MGTTLCDPGSHPSWTFLPPTSLIWSAGTQKKFRSRVSPAADLQLRSRAIWIPPLSLPSSAVTLSQLRGIVFIPKILFEYPRSKQSSFDITFFHNRAVAMTTEAAAAVCGQEARDGYIKVTLASREEMSKFRSKKDILESFAALCTSWTPIIVKSKCQWVITLSWNNKIASNWWTFNCTHFYWAGFFFTQLPRISQNVPHIGVSRGCLGCIWRVSGMYLEDSGYNTGGLWYKIRWI